MMPNIGLASVSGAPGVTTTALALSYISTSPTLIVEADTSHASSILAGFLQGTVPPDRGLLEVAMQTTTQRNDGMNLWEEVLQIDDDGRQYVLPGTFDPTAATGIDNHVWSLLSAWIRSMANGLTPIIDFGRLSPHDRRQSLLAGVSHLGIVCHATLPDVLALQGALPYIHELLPADMIDSGLGLVLVDQPGIVNYSDREISRRLHIPVFGRIKHDPKTAMAFSHHTRELPDGRAEVRKAVRKNPLLRSTQSLRSTLDSLAEKEASVVAKEGVDAL